VASQDLPLEVAPDRPSLTNSAQTVPVGALQIELGLEYAPSSLAASPPERRLAMQATLRAGLTDRLEVRLDSEPLVWLRQAQDHTGLGDVALGMKYRFFDPPEGGWWPSLGIEPTANLPVGNMPIGSGRTDFGVRLLASQDLPWQLSLDINARPVAVGQVQPHGYLLQALTSDAVSRKVGEHQSPYAEVFFASREERDERETLGLDAGIIYFLTRRKALDAAMGTTLTGQGPDYVLRAGFSVLLSR
jgi:Putative MetA-pathway of phenol degradation